MKINQRENDSIEMLSKTVIRGEALREHFCAFCRRAGVPVNDCYISELEIGGVDDKTGDIICKYCLNLIRKLGVLK
ncbi:MAG TPA: hypothetical protein PLN24_09360 [Victivallales bacterium]|nr:hypothetical protein [Victivallales bacterium]HRU01599.1 hypothetical protein [Victivallales bacterium]